MQTGIHNKVALATASTQGIGFATAQLLAEEGATVWVHGRGGDNLQDALRRIRQAVPGARVNGVAADLAADDGVRHLLEQVPAADILVNGYADTGAKMLADVRAAECAGGECPLCCSLIPVKVRRVMARVAIVRPEQVEDPVIREIFSWVTSVEGAVPNHFYVEMNFPEFLKAKLGATRVLWEQGELSLPEIQHIGILVSRANGCSYCTAAFCTILNYGLGTAEDYVRQLASDGVKVVDDARLRTLIDFALKVNADAKTITDADVDGLRACGLTDKGVVQLVHLVGDFASYNRLNLALDTDYDYRDIWLTPR